MPRIGLAPSATTLAPFDSWFARSTLAAIQKHKMLLFSQGLIREFERRRMAAVRSEPEQHENSRVNPQLRLFKLDRSSHRERCAFTMI